MSLHRSAETHGEPRHPVPCLDHASWRRFLEPVDLYVISTDDGIDPKEVGDVMLGSLHALETLSGTLTDDPDEVQGGIVFGTGEKFAIVYESDSIGSTTTITVNAILGDHHHGISLYVPTEHGAWPIMPPDDAGGSIDGMRTALRRFHRVLCCHLRKAIIQIVKGTGSEDDLRRRAIMAAHVIPIVEAHDERPGGVDLATPWGGPTAVGTRNRNAIDPIIQGIPSLSILDGTRLAIRVNHMPAEDGRGPITSIDMAPVRETIGREAVDVVECMRQAHRLEAMGPLKR